jgi:hypothetical protein
MEIRRSSINEDMFFNLAFVKYIIFLVGVGVLERGHQL